MNSLHGQFAAGPFPGGNFRPVDGELFDVSAQTASGDVTLTLTATARNAVDSAFGSGVVVVVTFGEDASYLTIDLRRSMNEQAHQTAAFTPSPPEPLILRRAQYATFNLEFAGAFQPECTKPRIRLSHDFNEGPPTEIVINPQTGQFNEMQWNAALRPAEQAGHLLLDVWAPATAPVGAYSITLEIFKPGFPEQILDSAPIDGGLIILFNPWSTIDSVYMADAIGRQEYLLATHGLIWQNDRLAPTAFPWSFDQFDGTSLSVALDLLTGMTSATRAAPTLVARELSAKSNMVPPDDADNGVIVGNWGLPPYTGGTSPLVWTGSQAILAEYAATNQPVKYGQCWVFAGVLTTALRALGIPSRPITNYESLHDQDGDGSGWQIWKQSPNGIIRIDRNDARSEGVWNFHAWVEAWMTRVDLPLGASGWQVVDGTPQEESNGRYQLGPAAVSRVKAKTAGQFDTPFVSSEVDGDVRVRVEELGTGAVLHDEIRRKRVGFLISTKSPNAVSRLDVTTTYKVPELYEVTVPDSENRRGGSVSATFSTTSVVPYGAAAEALLMISNTTPDDVTLRVRLDCSVLQYNGDFISLLSETEATLALEPDEVQSIALPLDGPTLKAARSGFTFLEFSGSAYNESFDEVLLVETRRVPFGGLPPIVSFRPEAKSGVGGLVRLEVSWTNPTAAVLDKVIVSTAIEGAIGLHTGAATAFAFSNVAPGATVQANVLVDGVSVGVGSVLASVQSSKLGGATAEGSVDVLPCYHSADIDGNGAVAFTDLLLIYGGFGPAPPFPARRDLNLNGAVEFGDVLVVLSQFGASCP